MLNCIYCFIFEIFIFSSSFPICSTRQRGNLRFIRTSINLSLSLRNLLKAWGRVERRKVFVKMFSTVFIQERTHDIFFRGHFNRVITMNSFEFDWRIHAKTLLVWCLNVSSHILLTFLMFFFREISAMRIRC